MLGWILTKGFIFCCQFWGLWGENKCLISRKITVFYLGSKVFCSRTQFSGKVTVTEAIVFDLSGLSS